MYSNGAEEFHHVAFFSADYESDRDRMVAQGVPVASEFVTGFGAKICYCDARSSLGHMIEIYPEHEIISYVRPVTDGAGFRLGNPLCLRSNLAGTAAAAEARPQVRPYFDVPMCV